MSDTGWAARQIANTEKDVYEWPEWMRRAAGFAHPERCAINDLRAQLDGLAPLVAAAKEVLAQIDHWATNTFGHPHPDGPCGNALCRRARELRAAVDALDHD